MTKDDISSQNKFIKTQNKPLWVSFENSAVYKPIRPLLFLFCQKSVMNELRKHINRKFLFAGSENEVVINIQPVVYLMVLYLDHLDFVFYTALCHRFHLHQLSTVSLVLK